MPAGNILKPTVNHLKTLDEKTKKQSPWTHLKMKIMTMLTIPVSPHFSS